jgi:hypothetical protein
VTDPTYGVLKVTPYRIDLLAGADMMAGKGPTMWKA